MNKQIAALMIVGAVSLVNGNDGTSKIESFYKQSDSQNELGSKGKTALIIGFGVFGLFYLYTVVYIFYDLFSNIKMYGEMIEEDKKTLKYELNVDPDNADFQDKLNDRLKGIKEEEGGDDQLLGEASKLNQGEY